MARIAATVVESLWHVAPTHDHARTMKNEGISKPVHGFLHLATGAAWMVAVWYQSGRCAETVNKTLGIFWLVVGALGNLGLLEGVEALAFDDNGVHLIIGAVSTAIGWGQPALAGRT